MRVAYGSLSQPAFRQNALLKLLKHGLSCACCLASGCLLPLTLGVPSHLFFIISDLARARPRPPGRTAGPKLPTFAT